MENTVSALPFTEWLFKPKVIEGEDDKKLFVFETPNGIEEVNLVSYEGEMLTGGVRRGTFFNIISTSLIKHIIEENNASVEWLEGLDATCENLAIEVDDKKRLYSNSFETYYTLTLREAERAKIAEFVDLEDHVNYAIRFKLTPWNPFYSDSDLFMRMLTNPQIGPNIQQHSIISANQEIPDEEFWHLCKKDEEKPTEPFLAEGEDLPDHLLIMVANFINSKTDNLIHDDMYRNIDTVQSIKIRREGMILDCISVRFHLLGGTYILGATASMDLDDEEALT